jgi:hypothetical protein
VRSRRAARGLQSYDYYGRRLDAARTNGWGCAYQVDDTPSQSREGEGGGAGGEAACTRHAEAQAEATAEQAEAEAEEEAKMQDRGGGGRWAREDATVDMWMEGGRRMGELVGDVLARNTSLCHEPRLFGHGPCTDGGKVLCETVTYGLHTGGCVVYSFGVGFDTGFERALLRHTNCTS